MRMTPEVSLNTKTYIYGLTDPRSGDIRYVGQTVSLDLRMRSHATCAERGDRPNSPRNRWLSDLVSAGLVPGFVVLEECLLGEAHERERFWYDKLRGSGANLVNGKSPTMSGVAALLHKRDRQMNGTYIYESWEKGEHDRLHQLNPPGCGCKDYPRECAKRE